MHWRRLNMCRQRFLDFGIEGLHEELHSGRPRIISDEKVATVVRKTLNTNPKDGTQWLVRTLEQSTWMFWSTVRCIWIAFGLQLHRQRLVLIVDNYAAHKHSSVTRWLATHPRYKVHCTPTYASWLNQVEIWFNLINAARHSTRNIQQCQRSRCQHRPFGSTLQQTISSFPLDGNSRFNLCKVISDTRH